MIPTYFPDVGMTGRRPHDIFGFGDVQPGQEAGIGCEACGPECAALEEFRRAQMGIDSIDK